MDIWHAIVLGAVEGLTEFLPISSTGHLTIAEQVLGLDVADPAVTGFTAVIQVGAILAVLISFAGELAAMPGAFLGGLGDADRRRAGDFRYASAVLLGSLPICLVGVATKELIVGRFRSLWVVAAGLVLFSAVMVLAERRARRRPAGGVVTVADGVALGLAQVLALVPGVSRSGATISCGLLRGLDRVTATRLSFFLGIPALVGAGVVELPDAFSGDVGTWPLVVGTLTSFVVALASISWLLRFVAHHSLAWFAGYRVVLGEVIAMALLLHGR